MQLETLSRKAQTYLQKLCEEIETRRVGSAGNQTAAHFFAQAIQAFGFEVHMPEFACMDWQTTGADLTVGGRRFNAAASPYSLGCQVQAPLKVISTVAELADAHPENSVVLLWGEIASGQLMPKNFTFYNPDEHKQIVALLEARPPVAIITAAPPDPQMAGSLYPYPMIEDGDIDIPSVYMSAEEGEQLAAYAGQTVTLESRTQRIASTGQNVIARKGSTQKRVVYFAHIDAKIDTRGAIDNASGIITLLLLAELLAQYDGNMGIEIVALNGEDYYSNPGEQLYLEQNADQFNQIVLGINIDGVGYHHGRIAYSCYECSDTVHALARQHFSQEPALTEGEPWYQGDHVLFLINQRPALAFTSEEVMTLMTDIIHTDADTPAIIDTDKLARLAVALHRFQMDFGNS